MRRIPRDFRWVPAVYAAAGLVLWPVPLLNVLHAESSAVIALISFFVAGLSSLHLLGRGMRVSRVLALHEAALVVPWAMLTLSVLWAPNCGYPVGLLLYVLFAPITVMFAIALAYVLTGTGLRRKRLTFVLIGLLILVLGPLYDIGFHPQFYTYNHVFGGILGPIYDQELALRPGLFVFRGLTLLWALFGCLLGWRLRSGDVSLSVRRKRMAATVATALLIGGVYYFSAPLGLNTPGWYIQRSLGAVYPTEHFDIYYDPESVTPHEIAYIARDHEYQYQRLAGILDAQAGGRILSYLYPDPEMKARLTGARVTNVAPVWLSEPQTHVLLPAYAYVFPHELAHVFSRGFGLPVLNATLSVGLVEGLAVALEPPDGLPSPHEQVIAAALERIAPEEEPGLADRLAATLTPFGFWTGRGAVSYTTMGSFVGYLLNAYGAERLKEVYALGNFEGVYGKPVDTLAMEWERYVLNQPLIPSIAGPLAARRFGIPSLFEVECPHYVPRYVIAYREGLDAWEDADTLGALAYFEKALEMKPDFPAGLAAWAQAKLAQGAPHEVVERLSATSGTDSLWSALAALGDARALLEQEESARAAYDEAMQELPAGDRERQNLLLLRKRVAGRPEVIRILTAGMEPGERARRLAPLAATDPVVATLQALLLAEAEAFREAVAVLEHVPPQPATVPYAERLALERQRLEWLSHFAYHAGLPEQALAYAAQAAEAWMAVGGVNEVMHLMDLREKYAWAFGVTPE